LVPAGFERIEVGFDGNLGHKSGGVDFMEIFLDKIIADKLDSIFFDEMRGEVHIWV
jgi:hypothetical protein